MQLVGEYISQQQNIWCAAVLSHSLEINVTGPSFAKIHVPLIVLFCTVHAQTNSDEMLMNVIA